MRMHVRVAAFTNPNEVLCVPIVSHVSTSGTVDSTYYPSLL